MTLINEGSGRKKGLIAEMKIKELGYELPGIRPIGTYAVAKRSKGGLIFTSGQIPSTIKGHIDSSSIEDAKKAARECIIKSIAAIKAIGIDLDAVNFLKVVGSINSAPGFIEQHIVMNAASELLAEIFGPERGVTARAAVGMFQLPTDASVEIEVIAEDLSEEEF